MTTKLTNEQNSPLSNWLVGFVILLVVLLVWHGAIYSGFTPDDYAFFDVLAPIRTFGDVIAAFWRDDPNPQYWRPTANITYSWDFLLWGWNGYAFHATNILLHAIASILIYYFVQRFFRLNRVVAFLVAIFFGVSCSHDSNVLWISARTDVIAVIFMMSVLLASARACEQGKNAIAWTVLSFFCAFFAFAAKEICIVLLILLPLLVWSDGIKDLWQKKKYILRMILPYILIAALFFFIRSRYTIPLSEMQPLTAEGSHSIIAFAKNAMYSIGYVLLPVDFQTASVIINRYAIYGYLGGSIFFLLVAFYIVKNRKLLSPLLFKPTILTITTGIVAFQSFERWRIYFPSVGVLTIIAVLLTALWNSGKDNTRIKVTIVIVLVALSSFHIYQSVRSQEVWAQASAILYDGEKDIQDILAAHTERPITLYFITCPIKIGGAGVMQLGRNYMVLRDESVMLNLSELQTGSLASVKGKVKIGTSLDIYALNPEKGFHSLSLSKKSEHIYQVSCDPNEIGIGVNTEMTDGVARRDRVFKISDVLKTDVGEVTIVKAAGSFASEVQIHIIDTTGLPIYFDGKHFKVLE